MTSLLVYARNKECQAGICFRVPRRQDAVDTRNPDNDPRGEWRAQATSAASNPYSKGTYAIRCPEWPPD